MVAEQVFGVFAGLSVHLQPGRVNGPKMNDIGELYVDIGAKNAEEVKAAGVDVLDPLVLTRKWFPSEKMAESDQPPGIVLAQTPLVHVLEQVKGLKAKGTTTIAFLTQQWIGARGLNRVLTEMQADELIYVGESSARTNAAGTTPADEPRPGAGVLVGSQADTTGTEQTLAAEFQAIAEKEQIPNFSGRSRRQRNSRLRERCVDPKRWVELGVPTLWPVTRREYVC